MTYGTFEIAEALANAGDENLLRELIGILLTEGADELTRIRSGETRGDAPVDRWGLAGLT